MKKIEKLTGKQELLMGEIAEEYEEIALSGDDSYDSNEIKKGVDLIYAISDFKPPEEIVVCSSPMDMKVRAKLKKGETFDWIGVGYDAGWTAFYDFMQQIGVEYDAEWKFNEWKNFIKNSGVFAMVLFENVAFACIRPAEVHRNSAGDLHSVKGMAISWKDGYGEYALNGVWVDKDIVMTPAEQLDPRIIFKEKNAEVRREIVRKIGMERTIVKCGAKTLDKRGSYELLTFDIGDGRERPYLKMRNPSIKCFHVEGVAPGIKTVNEALKWRNGIDGNPVKLT